MRLKIRPGDVTDELTPGMPEAERYVVRLGLLAAAPPTHK